MSISPAEIIVKHFIIQPDPLIVMAQTYKTVTQISIYISAKVVHTNYHKTLEDLRYSAQVVCLFYAIGYLIYYAAFGGKNG